MADNVLLTFQLHHGQHRWRILECSMPLVVGKSQLFGQRKATPFSIALKTGVLKYRIKAVASLFPSLLFTSQPHAQVSSTPSA